LSRHFPSRASRFGESGAVLAGVETVEVVMRPIHLHEHQQRHRQRSAKRPWLVPPSNGPRRRCAHGDVTMSVSLWMVRCWLPTPGGRHPPGHPKSTQVGVCSLLCVSKILHCLHSQLAPPTDDKEDMQTGTQVRLVRLRSRGKRAIKRA
jgi:hypothetical protein